MNGATRRIDKRLHRRRLLILDVMNRAESAGRRRQPAGVSSAGRRSPRTLRGHRHRQLPGNLPVGRTEHLRCRLPRLSLGRAGQVRQARSWPSSTSSRADPRSPSSLPRPGCSASMSATSSTAAPASPPRVRYGWAGCSGPVSGCGRVCSMMSIFTMQNRRCQLTRFNRSLQAERKLLAPALSDGR